MNTGVLPIPLKPPDHSVKKRKTTTQVLQSFPDQTCPVAYSASKQKPQDDTNDLAIKSSENIQGRRSLEAP